MKAVVLHSGGLDSSVLLYHLRNLGYEVLPLTIGYGQRHSTEIQAAQQVCQAGRFPFAHLPLIELRSVMGGSSQTDASVPVPEGHYAEDNMKVTVVANRNMVLISIATAYAISQKARNVAYAAHAGDRAQYPDCRPEFINAMGVAIGLCDYAPPTLIAPFSTWTKADIVKRGAALNVPFKLTWSCYKGGSIPCGRCGTDVERAEAFHLAGVEDPTKYEDPEYWKTVTKDAELRKPASA